MKQFPGGRKMIGGKMIGGGGGGGKMIWGQNESRGQNDTGHG